MSFKDILFKFSVFHDHHAITNILRITFFALNPQFARITDSITKFKLEDKQSMVFIAFFNEVFTTFTRWSFECQVEVH